MSEGLFIVSKKTLNLDESISFPKGKWSGSIQFFTSGLAVLVIDDRVNYPVEVDKYDVLEFHGLPISKLISKSDGLIVTVIATPTCEIPSIVLHKALSEDILETINDYLYSLSRHETKLDIYNQSVTGGTNILSEDISPTWSNSIFRVQVAFDTAGVFSVVKTRNGTTWSEQLNSGNNLNANCVYIFDIMVNGETINFQYSVNATLLELKVIEMTVVV